jgi:hypothetical protein
LGGGILTYVRRCGPLLLAAAFLALPGVSAQEPQTAASLVIEHAPITDFARGAPLEFQARVSAPVAWLSVFLRYEGIQEFQARPMSKAADGSYALTFDTGILPAAAFEYFLGAGTPAGAA